MSDPTEKAYAQANCDHFWVGLKCQKCGESVPGRADNPALVAKMAEIFSADHHLHAAVFSLREWFNQRKPGEEFGLRLLDCQMWAANLEWLLVQAAIIVKGEEK